MRMSTMDFRLRPKQFVGLLTVAFLVAGWWILLRPTSLGGETTLITVSGTSMQPGMHTGDLAIVRQTGDYEIGEVLAYRVRHENGTLGATVIHRIVGGDAKSGFVMRGDNNEFRDHWRPRGEQIVGELWWHIPDAGTVITELGAPLLAASTFAALTVFMVIVGDRRDEEDAPRVSEPSKARARR